MNNYARGDFACEKELNEREGKQEWRLFYFLDEEWNSCKVKEPYSFKIDKIKLAELRNK